MVVHAPKGGVGKTTIATNVALHLARHKKRVWALDLAQGTLMTKLLESSGLFAIDSGNRIEEAELGELPTRFPGSREFDYLVADTDDYYKIYTNLLDKNRIGWRVLVPLVPGDQLAMSRISDETGKLMRTALFVIEDRARRPTVRVFVNNIRNLEGDEAVRLAVQVMEEHGIQTLLTETPILIPCCRITTSSFFLDDAPFATAINQLLSSVEVQV